jgi:hypothetical protein
MKFNIFEDFLKIFSRKKRSKCYQIQRFLPGFFAFTAGLATVGFARERFARAEGLADALPGMFPKGGVGWRAELRGASGLALRLPSFGGGGFL